MGKYLDNAELTSLRNSIINTGNAVGNNIERTINKATILVNTKNWEGGSASAMKRYFNSGAINSLTGMYQALTDMTNVVQEARNAFLDYESNGSGRVEEETLEKINDDIDNHKTQIDGYGGTWESNVSRGEAHAPMQALNLLQVRLALNETKTALLDIRNGLVDTDNGQAPSVRDMISYINQQKAQIQNVMNHVYGDVSVPGTVAIDNPSSFFEKVASLEHQDWYEKSDNIALVAEIMSDPWAYPEDANLNIGELQWFGGLTSREIINNTQFANYDRSQYYSEEDLKFKLDEYQNDTRLEIRDRRIEAVKNFFKNGFEAEGDTGFALLDVDGTARLPNWIEKSLPPQMRMAYLNGDLELFYANAEGKAGWTGLNPFKLGYNGFKIDLGAGVANGEIAAGQGSNVLGGAGVLEGDLATTRGMLMAYTDTKEGEWGLGFKGEAHGARGKASVSTMGSTRDGYGIEAGVSAGPSVSATAYIESTRAVDMKGPFNVNRTVGELGGDAAVAGLKGKIAVPTLSVNRDWVSQEVNNLGTNISDFGSDTGEFLTNVWTAPKQSFSNYGKELGEDLTQIKDGLGQHLSNAKDDTMAFVDHLTDVQN